MSGKNVIHVSRVLASIAGIYLDQVRQDLVAAEQAVAAPDWKAVSRIGHNLKGTGSGYGVPEFTRWGADLERAGKAEDAALSLEIVIAVREYLSTIEFVFDQD